MPTESANHQPEWLEAHAPSLGRYILGPILGQGGAGEVREAWDVVLCRTVALKVLRRMEPAGLIRFMHEAQLQGRIAHPNICHIYDVDTSAGVPKIAMQLIRGPDLAQLAPELTVLETATLMAQVAEAIHAAHRIKLIHRDLKPSNILLERSPDGHWTPYVCDFGLAMALDEPALTVGPGLVGTPAFMAPEQIAGRRGLVGPATDIYALGGTLHYALFGLPPPEPAGALLLQRKNVFPPGRSPQPDLPRDLETILRKCLEPDPAQRYGSALELAEELWLFAAGAPIQSRPLGPLARRWRQLRKYRTAALAVLVTAAGLGAGRLVEIARMNREQEQRAEIARSFVLEAADLDRQLRMEKMLPLHDMRPIYGRIRERMAAIQARMDRLGPAAQGPGHFALGRGRFLLRDFAGARGELEQAWDQGFREPEVAWLLARALTGVAYQEGLRSRVETGLPLPAQNALADRARELFRQGEGQEGDSSHFAEALLAYVQGDYRRAADEARNNARAYPWHYESANLMTFSLYALGHQYFDAGDWDQAEACYRNAIAASERFLAVGSSEDFAYNHYFAASLRWAYLRSRRGHYPAAFIRTKASFCRQALVLDPESPMLLDDWLQWQILRSFNPALTRRQADAVLERALAWVHGRVGEPLPVELRIDFMAANYFLAESRFLAGRDPGPHLAEALRNLGHTSGLRPREYLGDILDFKAQVEAVQGRDPRPTLDEALARLGPELAADATCAAEEAVAENWLIRARWEAGHGLDARASLQRCRAIADLALDRCPVSPRGQAIRGLAELEGRPPTAMPHPDCLRRARARLHRSLALGQGGLVQEQLVRALEVAERRSGKGME
jgi:serine/threonine-protein kinase